MRTRLEVRETRCRICQDEAVRRAVNELLDWRGVPVLGKSGKWRVISLTDIFRQMEPVNQHRSDSDRISYDSLWVHAKRHYDPAGKAAYWTARMEREVRKALAANSVKTY